MSPHCHLTTSLLVLALGASSSVLAQQVELIIEGDVGDELVIDETDGPTEDMRVIEETGAPAGDELVIEPEAPSQAPADTEMLIEPETDELIIDAELAKPLAGPDPALSIQYGLETARVEIGLLEDDADPVDSANYAHASGYLETDLAPGWELRLGARVDGYAQTGNPDYRDLELDYDDSYLRYRGNGYRLTAGAQTVIWGRIDELPPTDRLSRVDATRFLLDDLDERRRATAVVRYEGFFGDSKLDAVFVPVFREAELPDEDSVWYPIDQDKGRVLGLDPKDFPAAVVRNADIDDNAPNGDGGWGLRYSRTESAFDYAVTIQRNRQTLPYFVYDASSNTLEAEYPRSWSAGADAGFEAGGIIWRGEFAWLSDIPVTRTDFSYDEVEGINWGVGMEFFPGDGDTRMNLQVVGLNFLDTPDILDRDEVYTLNGALDIPFARERWRLNTRFFAGLNDHDVYVNPELAFLGWQPHEAYIAIHYFNGDDDTLAGFYDDKSLLTLGWRSKF
jgi:hypothetical protein